MPINASSRYRTSATLWFVIAIALIAAWWFQGQWEERQAKQAFAVQEARRVEQAGVEEAQKIEALKASEAEDKRRREEYMARRRELIGKMRDAIKRGDPVEAERIGAPFAD